MKNFSYCSRDYEVPRPFVAAVVPSCPIPALEAACSQPARRVRRGQVRHGAPALASAGTRRADPVGAGAVERAPLRVPSKGTSAAPVRTPERPRTA